MSFLPYFREHYTVYVTILLLLAITSSVWNRALAQIITEEDKYESSLRLYRSCIDATLYLNNVIKSAASAVGKPVRQLDINCGPPPIQPDLIDKKIPVIDGTPMTISLVYDNGELFSANNVTYKTKFMIPNETFKIVKFDKGTFDGVSQISNDTVLFNTARILKNENKTGLVVFDFEDDGPINRKLTIITDINIAGKSHNATIDPGIEGKLDVGTKIINLSQKAFELGKSFYNEIVSCVSNSLIDLNSTNPIWKLETKNCSNHPQLTVLNATNLPPYITPIFNPKQFDIPANQTEDSILDLVIMNNTLSNQREIPIRVFSDVVFNFFGVHVKVASATTESKFLLGQNP